MAGNATDPGRSVLSRAMAVLEAFDATHCRLRATAIAARADLPLSTAHRLLGELVAVGALSRTGGHYAIGQRIWNLGLLAPVQTGLHDVAAPFMQDVYAATQATVHLGIREGLEVLYLHHIAGNRSVPVVSSVGSRLPLHATGVGKVLLAWAPEDVRGQALSRLTRITAYTITHVGRMSEQLRRVREQGYATTSEEMSLGACSIAVPIVHGGRVGADEVAPTADAVVASLGLVVPELGRDRQRLVAALQVAARGIGRSLPE